MEKLSKLRSFYRHWRKPQNCRFQSSFTQRTAQFTQGISTVSSVYLPTPRWHHLKAHPFLAMHSADQHRMIYSFSNTTSFSTFCAFFSANVMADVASKHQMTALFLSTIVTRTRRHTELTQKNWQTWWETCAVPENIQFSFSCSFFLYTVKLRSLT